MPDVAFEQDRDDRELTANPVYGMDDFEDEFEDGYEHAPEEEKPSEEAVEQGGPPRVSLTLRS